MLTRILIILKRLKKIKIEKTFNHKFGNDLKLNLGCGRDYKKDWINIDNNSDNNIEKLDLKWDLSKGIPFKNDSVNFIFNEHFLEHLTVKEGQIFLKECRRVLKRGGVLRISMPDLERSVKEYFNENWKEDNKEAFEKFDLTFIQTRAERLNMAFRWWGHQWLYDKEELERRLKEAGFYQIEFCKLNESKHSELKNLETRNESILIAEVTK